MWHSNMHVHAGSWFSNHLNEWRLLPKDLESCTTKIIWKKFHSCLMRWFVQSLFTNLPLPCNMKIRLHSRMLKEDFTAFKRMQEEAKPDTGSITSLTMCSLTWHKAPSSWSERPSAGQIICMNHLLPRNVEILHYHDMTSRWFDLTRKFVFMFDALQGDPAMCEGLGSMIDRELEERVQGSRAMAGG